MTRRVQNVCLTFARENIFVVGWIPTLEVQGFLLPVVGVEVLWLSRTDHPAESLLPHLEAACLLRIFIIALIL